MKTDVKILDSSIARSRVLDYIELMKPELTFLSVLSALCGFYLGSTGTFDAWRFIHTAVGTMLLGGGAGTLNQFIERNYDVLMKRTERRPLPSGRLVPAEALFFGILLSIAGIIQLSIFTNFLTVFLGTVTFTMYIFLYTPLKRITPLATLIGAIPGALPPMMGWAAARNELSIGAWTLFAILFCWQMPHFLSLAWMYRKDYARAGYKFISVSDTTGRHTSRQIMFYTTALLPLTLQLSIIGKTGTLYSFAAIIFGLLFLMNAVLLIKYSIRNSAEHAHKYNAHARRLFFASLLYLPLLMTFMTIDKV